jgi:serine/threonine protein phosphatase PrpC
LKVRTHLLTILIASMESLTSLQSSDSDNSLLSVNNDHKYGSSTNSLLGAQMKHLCPTNILKFSKLPIPHKLLGYRRTHFPGSATATICVLNSRDLSALNLGDSGFILIRFDSISNEPYILLKSKEQQHGFNTPY